MSVYFSEYFFFCLVLLIAFINVVKGNNGMQVQLYNLDQKIL